MQHCDWRRVSGTLAYSLRLSFLVDKTEVVLSDVVTVVNGVIQHPGTLQVPTRLFFLNIDV